MVKVTILEKSEFAPSDGDDVSFEPITLEDDSGENDPHLVLLIPGILTDGEWAQELRFESQIWAGRTILCKPIRGNGASTDKLNLIHLLTRIGLPAFRNSFQKQISHVISKYDVHTVNVVAHSMGSALFAEIVGVVSGELEKKNHKLNTVVFLGSICHRKHSHSISSNCEKFVNDVGRYDVLPVIASALNKWRYGDVGTRGFLDGYVTFDRFFLHNHSDCTSISHLKNKVIPLIETSTLTELGSYNNVLEKAVIPSWAFTYLKLIFWIIGAVVVFSIISMIWLFI